MVKNKPLSWKWRIAIGFLVLFIVAFAFVFTPSGFVTMKGWLDTAYEECPPNERAAHWSADAWLMLAYWEGNICGRRKEALDMYKEFIGILPNPKTNEDFFDSMNSMGVARWNGKYDPKKKEGWGFIHPYACEAYWHYLEIYDPMESAQFTAVQARNYFTLFHEYYKTNVKGGKPHPQFYVKWEKIRFMIDKGRIGPSPVAMPKPTNFAGPQN